jgi:formylglycine-generating enzyme required for sulfatase activity
MIGKHEVTQGQWKMVMGSNPSNFKSCGDNCPVERVSWDDAQQFINKLNSMTGKRYRLPTEAEWEYACRAGGAEEYCGSNKIDAVAWYEGNSGRETHPVGQKQANAWGIHDMSGNVWEWCQDWYGSSYPSGTKNPTGASSGSGRVDRGGSWDGGAGGVRSANRGGLGPGLRDRYLGFRLLLPSVQ